MYIENRIKKISMVDQHMKDNSARSAMLAEYSVRVKILMEYIYEIDPWGGDVNKVKCALKDLNECLRFQPFVGLVVKQAPLVGNVTLTKNGGTSYSIQGKEFCDWFNNLRLIELTDPKEGEVGFRLDEISPRLSIDRVVFFYEYGWLSSLQRRKLREENPEFISKIAGILLGKPLRRLPQPDNIQYLDVDDVMLGIPKLDTHAYRLVSIRPFQVEDIVFTPFGWHKINKIAI